MGNDDLRLDERLTEAAAPIATVTEDGQTRRFADFDTLGAALDYAAQGTRGLNFHDARGTLARPYPFAELRRDALAAAHAWQIN